MSSSMVTYVPNKPSLILSKDSLARFGKNEVVIPMAVLEDLQNSLPTLDFAKQLVARNLLRYLDEQDFAKLTSKEGIKQKNGGILRVSLNYKEVHLDIEGLSLKDKRILQTCVGLKQDDKEVILISNNPILRMKAKSLNIKAEELTDELFPKLTDQYLGVVEAYTTNEAIDILFRTKKLNVSKVYDSDSIKWYKNLYIKLTASDSSALGYFNGNYIVPISTKYNPYGLVAKNVYQTFLLHALMDESTPLVIVKGNAGTGKTICALAAALEQTSGVGSKNLYEQILITKSTETVNQEQLGFLPGDIREKVDPYVKGIYDNLKVIMHSKKSAKGGLTENGEFFFEKKIIEIQTIGHIRGRSIGNTFHIFDEAQNISPTAMRSIVTRAGEGSKFVFLGDPTQIDTPELNERYNGLTFLSELMKGQELCRQVSLMDSGNTVRSPLAKLAVELVY